MTVTATIDAIRGEAQRPRPSAKPRAPVVERCGGNRVLVVDDDEALLRSMQRILRRAGFDVILALTAESAIEAVAREELDVIVSDIVLPGASGVDLLRKVREYDLDVPVILMTGTPSVETAMQAVSLGALQYLPKPTSNQDIVAAVDRASKLHKIARSKREALSLLGGVESAASDRAGLQGSLERALEGMWMAFQPIVDLQAGRVFGYEALMRTTEPSLPHPGAILHAAERLDRLGDVGRRVRELTAAAFATAPSDALLFVNLHTRDLLDPTLYGADAALAPFAERVVLEITERVAIDDVKDIRPRVATLRDAGYRIAIDDLGAGYAGLSSFAALEPEIVKLDMSLVRDIHTSPVRQRLVASMAGMCRDMGILVVAEGIEIAEERDVVARLGCSLHQGYLFARPGRPFPKVELR